jgi:cell division protein YceG involved in septum cleavage
MLNNFNNKVYKKLLKQNSPKEILNIINLSSIVEKEEKDNNEKPIVA